MLSRTAVVCDHLAATTCSKRRPSAFNISQGIFCDARWCGRTISVGAYVALSPYEHACIRITSSYVARRQVVAAEMERAPEGGDREQLEHVRAILPHGRVQALQELLQAPHPLLCDRLLLLVDLAVPARVCGLLQPPARHPSQLELLRVAPGMPAGARSGPVAFDRRTNSERQEA